jgi:hypothetical protein
MLCFISSCDDNIYDDLPTGIVYTDNEDSDPGDELESLSDYVGGYTSVDSEVLEFDKISGVGDTTIQLVNIERRYTKCVIILYANVSGLLHNFTINLEYYDSENNSLGILNSEPVDLIGCMYNTIIIDLPDNAQSFSFAGYNADSVMEIIQLILYDFDDNLQRESQTTFVSNYENANIVFLADNRVVAIEMGAEKGLIVEGMTGINRYGVLEVKN